MKLNSKLTGGLAWAGLILVLAVPSADMLTKASGNAAATMTSDMDAVDTAGAAPAAVETAAPEPRVILARPGEAPVVVQAESQDPVDEYLSSGKKLPSYISDAPAEVASKEPAPVTRLVVPGSETTATTEPVEVAAVDKAAPAVNANLAPPLPYPASMRPVAPAPVVTASAVPATSEEAPVIVDEELVARREAAVAAVLGDDPIEPRSPGIVTGDELEEWDSGSLAEYLERRGLISSGSDEATRDDFDEDGFYLDEGPNNDEERLRRRLRRDFIFF